MWPCLDKQKGHVLQFCYINCVNLTKKLSQLFQSLARSLVQHRQLTPTRATMDCVGCEGLQRSVAVIRVKKTPFLQPSLSGHGALQGMAVTSCCDIPHTLQGQAVIHGKLGWTRGEGALHTHILKHSFNPT